MRTGHVENKTGALFWAESTKRMMTMQKNLCKLCMTQGKASSAVCSRGQPASYNVSRSTSRFNMPFHGFHY